MHEIKSTLDTINSKLNIPEEKLINMKTWKRNQYETQREKRIFKNEVSCGTTSRVLTHTNGISEGGGRTQ